MPMRGQSFAALVFDRSRLVRALSHRAAILRLEVVAGLSHHGRVSVRRGGRGRVPGGPPTRRGLATGTRWPGGRGRPRLCGAVGRSSPRGVAVAGCRRRGRRGCRGNRIGPWWSPRAPLAIRRRRIGRLRVEGGAERFAVRAARRGAWRQAVGSYARGRRRVAGRARATGRRFSASSPGEGSSAASRRLGRRLRRRGRRGGGRGGGCRLRRGAFAGEALAG